MENTFAKKVRLNGGNIKLGNMLSFSKLYGDMPHYIARLGMVVTGTCCGHCDSCRKDCYVRKSYRYGSVMYRHAVNTLAFREDIRAAFQTIDNQLSRKRVPAAIVRINQSGELETTEEFKLWCEIATKHSNTQFYLYSKAYEIIIPALQAGIVPDNFTVLISLWHDVGMAEYAKVAHLPNVKVFAYDDNDYSYDDNGLHIGTYCRAYDDNGKLDHNITCDKCRKCFDRSEAHKIIGCKAH